MFSRWDVIHADLSRSRNINNITVSLGMKVKRLIKYFIIFDPNEIILLERISFYCACLFNYWLSCDKVASDEKLLFALSLLKEDDCGNSFYASNAISVSVDVLY